MRQVFVLINYTSIIIFSGRMSLLHIESETRAALGRLLDAMQGPKDLVLDPQLVIMLNRVAGFSFLKVRGRSLSSVGCACVF